MYSIFAIIFFVQMEQLFELFMKFAWSERNSDLSKLKACDDHHGENTSITQFGKLCSICMNYLGHIGRSLLA